MILALAAVLLPEVTLRPLDVPCGFWPCPQVEEVRHAATSSAFNIVFISAGFSTDDELEVYRCSVDRLVDGLMTSDPWKSYACAIGAYRIDARADASGIGTDPSCTAVCEPNAVDFPSGDVCTSTAKPSLPIWPGSFCEVADTDIEVNHCTDNVCRLVWPTTFGLFRSFVMALGCVPNPAVIVIVANSNLQGGGGKASIINGYGPGFVVVTIDNILDDTGWHRLAHELGHVLGLLDEYGDPNIDALDFPYQCERNLYSPDLAAAAGSTDTITWEKSCTTYAGLTCPSPSSGQCQIVCSCSSGCAPCCFKSGGDYPAVALFEGGFYKTTGVFRSEEKCMMNNYEDDLCDRCIEYGKDALSNEVGFCVLPHPETHVALFAREVADIEYCGTIPHPPWPPSDVGSKCPNLSKPVAAIRATIKVKDVPGLFAEIPVSKASFEVADPTKPSRRRAYDLSVVSKAGTPYLVWKRKGKSVEPSKVTAIASPKEGAVRLGTVTKPLIVVDAVTGATWEATELVITTRE